MRSSITINSLSELSDTINAVQSQLTAARVEKKQILRSLLSTEEILVEFLQAGMPVTVQVRKLFHDVSVRIYAKGPKLDLGSVTNDFRNIDMSDASPEVESAIRGLILRAQEKWIQTKWQNGVNTVILTVRRSNNHTLALTLGCMAVGILTGFLLRMLLPESATLWISENLLDTASSMFINAVMMLVGPLVFFSMASCIASFRDLSALGRIGGKVMGMYLFTTCCTIFTGICVFFLLQPGNPALLSAVTIAEGTASEVEMITLRGTIINIIPSNLIGAFLNMDLIQILFLGILFGVAAGTLGEYSGAVQHSLDVLNALFSKMITYVTKLMPVAAFCSMAKLLLTIDFSSISSLLYIAFGVILADSVTLLLYVILMRTVGKLNPWVFFKKFFSTMATAFSLCSSSAVMPMSMQTLGSRMGVSPKVYSFSIPLGTTVNMDGFCNYLLITVLAFMKILGVEFNMSIMATLCLSVLLISIGAPGVPGVGVLTVAMLLRQIGLPTEISVLAIGICSLVEPVLTLSNITGDATVTMIVAKSEGLLDEAVFYDPQK